MTTAYTDWESDQTLMAEPFIEFHVDTSALSRLAAAAPGMTPDIQEEMRLAMEESGMLLDTMIMARTPVNTGILRSSIQYPRGFEMSGSALDSLRGIVGARDFTMVGSVSTMVYVDYVETGTRAHWAPIQPIMLWAYRKFGKAGIRIAYAVRFKIAQYGTPAAHMFRNAWNDGGRAKVTRIWQRVLPKALQRWERSVKR
jgi:hypothetical protein